MKLFKGIFEKTANIEDFKGLKKRQCAYEERPKFPQWISITEDIFIF